MSVKTRDEAQEDTVIGIGGLIRKRALDDASSAVQEESTPLIGVWGDWRQAVASMAEANREHPKPV